MNKAAVLLLTFNRPDTTQKVLDEIRQYRPKQLFVAGDGPRNSSDRADIEEVKRIVRENADWDCELETSFFETNLGCRRGVVRAIDWFFARVSEGIILEDDCVPHPDFFAFCEEMLARYREEKQVMHVAGDNSAGVSSSNGESYTFVRYPHIWGWATWSRAWQKYDRDLTDFHRAVLEKKMRAVFPKRSERRLWVPLLESLRETGVPDTWDWQWAATLFLQDGLSVQPTVNLVSNIGFDSRATHTSDAGPRSHYPSQRIYPLIHPQGVKRDRPAERRMFVRTQRGINGRVHVIRRIFNRIAGWF